MKKIFMLFLAVILFTVVFTGCGPDEEKIQSDFIKILNQPASEESIKEASDYLDQYLSKVSDRKASEMVIAYEHHILSYDQSGINYKKWIKKYEKHIIPALTEIYQIEASEQKSPVVKDAVLQVSWKELAKRAYNMELLIRKFKEEELIKEDATWIYGNYINAMVMGANGTPVFDYKTHAFSEDAKTAYMSFINQHQDSVTAWALTEYFTYLNSIGYTMDFNDKVSSKSFFDTCTWLVSESGKRVYE